MSQPKTKKVSKEEKEAAKHAEMRVREQVMEKIRATPCLFDKGLPSFKDTAAKKVLVQKAADELQMSTDEFHKIYKYLRTGFTKEKKLRNKEHHSGVGKSDRKSFPFYEQLTFLEPFLRVKQSYNNFDDEGDEGDDDEDDGSGEEQESQDGAGVEELLNHTEKVASILLAEAVEENSGIVLNTPNSKLVSGLLETTPQMQDSQAKKSLFPDIPDQSQGKKRENGQGEASTIKKAKTEPVQVPSKTMLILEGEKAESLKDRRSKSKREVEVLDKLSRVIDSADKVLGAKEEISEIQLLGSRIQIGLGKVKNPRKQMQWRRKFERVLDDLEDDVLDEAEAAQAATQ